MTIDERLDRLEHFTAGYAEQARRDRIEDRALWRETQEQINLLTRRLTDAEIHFLHRMNEYDRRSEELRQEIAERDRKTDERIGALVSAIGELAGRGEKKL